MSDALNETIDYVRNRWKGAQDIIKSQSKRLAELQAENERLEWMLNFIAGKDAGLVNKAAWAWRKHQESGEAS